jgi:hypothetical protein
MRADEHHQQQLEQQQWYEDLENIQSDFNKNYGKFLGVARFIRDNARGERDVQDAVKLLIQVLEEHDSIERRLP